MKKKKIWLATAAAVLVCCLIILFVKGGDKGDSGAPCSGYRGPLRGGDPAD